MIREAIIGIGSAVVLSEISKSAFSSGVRKEIGRRDNWTCQVTGRKAKDGWLLDAAHYNHTRGRNYNTPGNGRMLCRSAHLQEHIGAMQADPTPHNVSSVHLIANRCYVQGLRKPGKYRLQPWLRYKDRQETIAIIQQAGLDPRDFIDFDKD